MGSPISRSTNRRSSAAELEIWFRIVHITPEFMGVRPEPKTPRVANLLRQAIVWRALLKSGEVSDPGGHRPPRGPHQGPGDPNSGAAAPRARDPALHPAMPRTVGCPTISERVLRSITMVDDPQQQLHAFADIVSK